MTNYDKLVAALRYHADTTNCDACKLYDAGKCELKSCVLHDAADAIEALQAEIRKSMQKCAECGDEQEQKVKELQAEVERVKDSNEELREKQTYIDHYGAKWMTSAKDVPNAAYEHGYLDGMYYAEQQLGTKHGEWVEDTTTYAGPGLSNYKCSLCGKICGTWRRGLEPSELPNWCGNCGADMRAKMEVQE